MKILLNEKFGWNGVPHEIIWIDDDLTLLILRDLNENKNFPIQMNELEQAITNLEICPLNTSPPKKERMLSLVDYPKDDPARIDAEYRLCYARVIARESMSVKGQEEFLAKIAEHYHHTKIPRPSSARRWAQQYKALGEIALLDGRRMKKIEVAGIRQ